MKLYLIAACIFIQMASAFAQGGGGASGGNGAGIAEMRFRLAHAQALKLFHYCANQGHCKLTDREMQISRQLSQQERLEATSPSTFVFESEKRRPGFFIIDGREKIAKTGLTYGSTIYVNEDLIYTKNVLGDLEPIPYLEVMQTVVHELGHHTGETDHQLLDTLGAKYAAFAKNFGFSAPMGFGADNIRFLSLNAGDIWGRVEVTSTPYLRFGTLSIEDGENLYDVTPLLTDELKRKRAEFYGPDSILQTMSFYSVRWEDHRERLFNNGKEQSAVRISGRLAIFGWKDRSKGGQLEIVSGYINFTIEFKVYEHVINVLHIVKDSAKLVKFEFIANAKQ